MAFLKYAKAVIVKPHIGRKEWGKVRVASNVKQSLDSNLVNRAATLFGKSFDPANYLMTHATIIASVDVEESGKSAGSFVMGGFKGNRKFTDYRITPATSKFINSNRDAWSREVLLKSYPTFIGGHNFCFAPGTLVQMGDGTVKAIEDVKVGEKVLTHTGQSKAVTHVFENPFEGSLVALKINNYPDPILVTGEHPFRGEPVKGKETWVQAKTLEAGSFVYGAEPQNQEYEISNKTTHPYDGMVYNLEVEGDSSYVLAPGIAVHNCEHVQIEDLSKGRIVDAVARDIGESIYVDILVATDRRHKDLIQAIESGKMSTMSMGCFLPGAPVTMADGTTKPIEDILPGELVLTHRGRFRSVVNKQIRTSAWGIRHIKADGVSKVITSTYNHPFYVFKQPDVCACGCGQALPTHDGPALATTASAQLFLDGHYTENLDLDFLTAAACHWTPASELRKGDFLCFPRILGGAFQVEDMKLFPITSIDADTYEGPVHNMEVGEDHSYVVEGVAVRNCTVDGTICTKCGHWAIDESELCQCIKYEKGNTFYDENGQSHVVAELCGHSSLDPHGGVQFIEASWVGVPAFTGAVLRNVITPTGDIAQKTKAILDTPPPQWSPESRLKAARIGDETDSVLVGWGDDEESTEPAEPAEPAKPFEDLENELVEFMRNKVQKRLKEEMQPPPDTSTPTPEQSVAESNDSVVKEAARVSRYLGGLDAITLTASDNVDLITSIAVLNNYYGVNLSRQVYAASVKLGSLSKYKTASAYWKACKKAFGREPTIPEVKVLLRLGKIIARRQAMGVRSLAVAKEETHEH